MDNVEPKIGEERYFAFVNTDGTPALAKVKVINRWEDKDAGGMVNHVKVLDPYFGLWKKGAKIHLDFAWQLQKTLEGAKKALIIGTFGMPKGPNEAWLYRKPPWE